jgi:hypothetical protein
MHALAPMAMQEKAMTVGIIEGWYIDQRDDGSFVVQDYHGIVAGPFGKKEEAFKAALMLPKAQRTLASGFRGEVRAFGGTA